MGAAVAGTVGRGRCAGPAPAACGPLNCVGPYPHLVVRGECYPIMLRWSTVRRTDERRLRDRRAECIGSVSPVPVRAWLLLPFPAAPMAKKSKRPPARKQQPRRPQQRPAFPQRPLSSAPAADLTIESVLDEDDDDYASGALPIPDSDGPMPLPPPETETAAPQPQQQVAATTTVTTGAPERRRVGRIDPAAAAVAAQRPGQRQRGSRTQSTAAMFDPLPPDDAAIPFDRVPYVPGDLRRVLIIAGLMIVLIVVADFVINAVVK